jgi:hypothetical protein
MKLNHRDIDRAIELELEEIDPNAYYRHSELDEELVTSGRPVKRHRQRLNDDERSLKQYSRK